MAKKRKRQWGATGVGEYEPPRLSPDTSVQIELILKDHTIAMPDMDGFFGALADAIGLYDTNVRLREKSLPSAVRGNLRDAEKAALHLNDKLNKLDGNSRLLLDETVPGGIRSLFSHVSKIILPLNGAALLADEYQSINYSHRYFLAADVKDAIETYLGVRAASTKNSLFVKVLESVMTEATGREWTGLHEMAGQVIKHKVKIKSPDGVIEYVPPPPKPS